MNGQILCGDTLLRLPSARVPRDDVAAFRTSTDLLERVKAMRDEAAIAAQEAQAAGYERGRQQALDEMRDALGEALAALAQGLAAENERRERAVAAAAMQVVERLIGEIDDRVIISGLAREALRKVGAGPTRVAVAPEWVEAVRERLADHADLTVEPAPVTDRFACRVTSQDGRIIADLDTQLAALRARWGLAIDGGDA
jgi:flagellar biosynthesis/type III secretory pathway protein FliH